MRKPLPRTSFLVALIGWLGCVVGPIEDSDDDPRDRIAAERIAAPPEFFGMSPDHGTWNEHQAHVLRALGVKTVRLQFDDWPASKPRLDAMVDTARAAGLSILAEINYSTIPLPGGVEGFAAEVQHRHEGFADAGNDFAHRFAAAAGEIAAHFRGRVEMYEIWNEPNATPLPDRQTDADWDGACGDYVYGLRADGQPPPGADPWGLCPRQLGVVTTNAFMTIRAADPGALIVAGNMLYHGEDGWVSKDYWDQVSRSPAVRWHREVHGRFPWDLVGFHPYGRRGRDGGLQREIDEMKALLARHGDPARLAITEYGFSTNGMASQEVEVDEADLAGFLHDGLAAMAAGDIAFVIWFNYLSEGNLDFGLRGEDRTWKRDAAEAYCRATGANNCPTRHRKQGWVGGNQSQVDGWAYDPAANGPISVELYAGGIRKFTTTANLPSGGLVHHKVAPHDRFGFQVPIASLGLPAGTHAITARGVGADGRSFDLQGSRVVTVGVPRAASFVSWSGVPAAVERGQRFTVLISMQNTGEETWTRIGKHRLGSQSPQDNLTWGIGRVELGASESIAPGATKTFRIEATAPSNPGTYSFRWRMVQDGVAWFGEPTPLAAIVVQ